MIILAKGANAGLPAVELAVTVRWDAGPAVDASALLVESTGKVGSDDDFVFYNQPEAAGGAVLHLGGTGVQRLRVRPEALPARVERVVLAASVDQGTFGALSGLELLVEDATGQPVARYPVEGAAGETVLVLGELYRRNGQWKIRAIGQGYDSGLAGLATDYGVTVDDEPDPAETPGAAPTPVNGAGTTPMPADGPGTGPVPAGGPGMVPTAGPDTTPMPVDGPGTGPVPVGGPGTTPMPMPMSGPGTAPVPGGGPDVRPGAAGGPGGAGEEALPEEMRRRISLRKEAVGVVLRKKGLAGTRARVAVVLDASYSMSGLYRRGTVGRVVERMVPVAVQLDSNGTLDGWIFAELFARLPELRVPDLPRWIRANVKLDMPASPEALGRRSDDRNGRRRSRLSLRRTPSVGVGNNEPLVMADVIDFYRERPSGEPTLVLFFSDGGVHESRKIAEVLRRASGKPIFWQFIGLGNADYGILEELDTLDGRVVDNAGFFSVDDIDKVSDEDLYERLLGEFPRWLQAAGAAGVLS